MSKTNGVNP